MNKVLASALSAAALFAFAAPAHAVTNLGNTDLTGVDLDSNPGFFFAQFLFSAAENTLGADPTGFTKTYTFDFPAAGIAAGSATSSLVGGANIIFDSVIFNGTAFALSNGNTQASLANAIANLAPPGQNLLTVNFKIVDVAKVAGFSGDISAQANAIPEPATWGLMILGLGFAGAAMRRRRQNVTVSYA